MGILGTPIVDLASRALFLDAMTMPDGGTTKKHLILSLNVDTGDINSGWPVDVEAMAKYNGMTFTAAIQQQRLALGHRGQYSLCWIWRFERLPSLSWLACGSADR
jgi:hypothetical protein